MTLARAGVLVSAVGYVLAISGGYVLFVNTPPDVEPGTIPDMTGYGATPDECFKNYEAAQAEASASRTKKSRWGFLLLTVGSTLQLVGTLVAGFLN